jgi:hypothetical protein
VKTSTKCFTGVPRIKTIRLNSSTRSYDIPKVVKTGPDRSNREPDLHPVRLGLQNRAADEPGKSARTGCEPGKNQPVQAVQRFSFFFKKV